MADDERVADHTRRAVHARLAASASATTARVAQIESELLHLGGKANRSERQRLNRELWALNNPAPTSSSAAAERDSVQEVCIVTTASQRVMAHWDVLHPEADTRLLSLCIRCGQGSAPTCRFHPDAKAFAFGTGRFEYGYTSAWDTPHEMWFCCGAGSAAAAGCCEESRHTVDPEWWTAYAGHAPALDETAEEASDEDDDDDDDDDGAMEGLAAMEIT